MKRKKMIYDVVFIVISAIILVVFIYTGLIEKYIGFSLIPILVAYYFGQFVERKTRNRSEL